MLSSSFMDSACTNSTQLQVLTRRHGSVNSAVQGRPMHIYAVKNYAGYLLTFFEFWYMN